MSLAPEEGETSKKQKNYNFACIKCSLRERSPDVEFLKCPHSRPRMYDFLSKKLKDMHLVLKWSSYTYPYLSVSGTFKRSLNWRNRGTLPSEIHLAVDEGIYCGVFYM